MTAFDVQNYGSTCAELLNGDHLCELGPGSPNRQRQGDLTKLTTENMLDGKTATDRDMAHCCISGLWLLHDYLDESHKISQEIHSTSGSYWHAIMPRREPDFSNSKYWFRRVGDHAIFPELCAESRELARQVAHDRQAEYLVGQTEWNPFDFVDLCEAVIRGRSTSGQLAQQVARLEWELLFDYCYCNATN